MGVSEVRKATYITWVLLLPTSFISQHSASLRSAFLWLAESQKIASLFKSVTTDDNVNKQDKN